MKFNYTQKCDKTWKNEVYPGIKWYFDISNVIEIFHSTDRIKNKKLYNPFN